MHKVTLIPGDGIGPEVTAATVSVLESTGVEFAWDACEYVGAQGVERLGTPLPDSVLASTRKNGVALKGPVTTPVGKGFRSVNVSLRQALDLYANVRPCRTLPGIETRFEDVDLVIFRENTEGLYRGIEYYDERLEVADSIARVTRKGSQRILRYAFEYARSHGRRGVTLVHKANILKATTGMFLEEGRRIAAEYPDVSFNDRIIDNMAMQLVTRPQDYDCIVTTNLFGDILSDLCAGLVGGLGTVPGANIGEAAAIFEAVHGSAPDIAGQGLANPTALLQCGVMMLHYLGEKQAATCLEEAIWECYAERDTLTKDVGGTASTTEFAEALAERIQRKI